MPGSLLTADTNFPDLSGGGSTEEKLQAVSGYLYMLLEQLRYTLNNLGQENFNDTELSNIGKIITEPVTIRLETAEGTLAALKFDVDGLEIQTDGASTYITGNHVRTGIIESQNGSSYINLNTGLAQLSGSYRINNPATMEQVGGIRYDTNGAGTGEEAKNRMFVFSQNGYALKVQASGNASIEGDQLIYLKAANNIVLSAGSTKWLFNSNGIYANGQLVVSATPQEVANEPTSNDLQ
jgi:hypothetical protein